MCVILTKEGTPRDGQVLRETSRARVVLINARGSLVPRDDTHLLTLFYATCVPTVALSRLIFILCEV